MRWTVNLWRDAACCFVLLLGFAVLLLPVCGPILCAHPCCPDHEPHCTVSAELANACSAQEHVKAPAFRAEDQHIPSPAVWPVSLWPETSSMRASGMFVTAQADPPAPGVPVPLRL